MATLRTPPFCYLLPPLPPFLLSRFYPLRQSTDPPTPPPRHSPPPSVTLSCNHAFVSHSESLHPPQLPHPSMKNPTPPLRHDLSFRRDAVPSIFLFSWGRLSWTSVLTCLVSSFLCFLLSVISRCRHLFFLVFNLSLSVLVNDGCLAFCSPVLTISPPPLFFSSHPSAPSFEFLPSAFPSSSKKLFFPLLFFVLSIQPLPHPFSPHPPSFMAVLLFFCLCLSFRLLLRCTSDFLCVSCVPNKSFESNTHCSG